MIYTINAPEQVVIDWLIDFDEALMSFKTVTLFRVSSQHDTVVFELKVEEVDEYYDDEQEKPPDGDGEDNGEGNQGEGPEGQGEADDHSLHSRTGLLELLSLGEVPTQGD